MTWLAMSQPSRSMLKTGWVVSLGVTARTSSRTRRPQSDTPRSVRSFQRRGSRMSWQLRPGRHDPSVTWLECDMTRVMRPKWHDRVKYTLPNTNTFIFYWPNANANMTIFRLANENTNTPVYFSAVNGPSKGHFSVVNGPSKGHFSTVNWRKRA